MKKFILKKENRDDNYVSLVLKCFETNNTICCLGSFEKQDVTDNLIKTIIFSYSKGWSEAFKMINNEKFCEIEFDGAKEWIF